MAIFTLFDHNFVELGLTGQVGQVGQAPVEFAALLFYEEFNGASRINLVR